MTIVSITGTPGTGKTSVSAELRRRGYTVIDANIHLREHGLLTEKDEARDTYNVDMERFNESLQGYRDVPDLILLDSHLSHGIDCSRIIVLRCNPEILAERLSARGYSDQKIRENVQAEILDVILCEATDTDIPVHEIDCSEISVSDAVDFIERILNGETELCPPGQVDWSGEMEEWF